MLTKYIFNNPFFSNVTKLQSLLRLKSYFRNNDSCYLAFRRKKSRKFKDTFRFKKMLKINVAFLGAVH